MRSETRRDSRLFAETVRTLLRNGFAARFRANGRSMYPAVRDGDEVQVEPTVPESGDVVMVETEEGLRVHRVVGNGTRGDCCFERDSAAEIIGKVSLVNGQAAPRQKLGSKVRRWIARWRGRF